MKDNKSIINHLYKYITIFMVIFSIGFSSLNIIKAEGNSLIYHSYTVKWVYSWTTGNSFATGSIQGSTYNIDLTISFDDYYSGIITLNHTTYSPSYICIGAQVDSNTSNALRVQFTNVNQIYLKFIFSNTEVVELGVANPGNWTDNGTDYFTFTSSTSTLSLGTRPADILAEIEDVNTTLTSTSTNISTMTSKLNQLFNYITALYSNSNNMMSTLGTISSNIDNVETYLSSLITTSEDTNAVVDEILYYVDGLENYCSQILDDTNTLVTDITDIQTNISTMTSKLNQLYNYITALYTNSNTIVSKLSDVNSNLTSIISSLMSMNISNKNQEYLSRALYDANNFMIYDISHLDVTTLITNVFNLQTTSIGGLFDYSYIILYSYLSAGNFNYFVIDLTSGYQTSNQLHWISNNYYYTLSYILSTENTIFYSLERYDFTTGTSETMSSSNYISIIYGTNEYPFSQVETLIDETNEYLSDILITLNSINDTISTDVMNKLDQIDDHLDNYTDYYDYDEMTWDEEFQSLPIDITGPLNVYKDIGTELYSDIMSTNFKYIVYAGYIMLMLGVFL